MIEQGDLSTQELAIAHSRRSDAHMLSRDWDKAIEDREKALKLDPGKDSLKRRLSAAYTTRGDASAKAKKPDAALGDYSKAIQLDPKNDALFARRSETYLAKGEVSSAIADLAEARRLKTDNAEYRDRLIKLNELHAVQLLESEDYKGAAKAYSKALELKSDDPKLLLGRAAAYVLARDHKRAVDDYSEVLRLQPENLEVQLSRGEQHIANGATTQAIEDFNEVIRLDKKNTRAFILRGLAHEKSGDKDAALSNYLAALKIDPDNEDAKVGRARIRRNADDIVRLIQVELKRVGCDPGKIDGKWGRRSKDAWSVFTKLTGNDMSGSRPNEEMLGQIENHDRRVCPEEIESASGEKKNKPQKSKKLYWGHTLEQQISCCIRYHRKVCRGGYDSRTPPSYRSIIRSTGCRSANRRECRRLITKMQGTYC